VEETRFSVRPFGPADYEPMARLDERLDPGYALSAEQIQHWEAMETAAPGHISVKLAVEDRTSGGVVAYGHLAHASFNYHPQKFWIGVSVDPDFTGRGIATELYGRLEREARQRDALCLWSDAREDDPRAVRFFHRNGFVTLRSIWRSRLDVGAAHLEAVPDRSRALADQGIRLTTVAAEGFHDPGVRRRVFELSRVASADVPRVGEYTPVSYEQFVQIDLETPGGLPDGFFLAAHADRYIGMTVVQQELGHPDTLHVGFTGTLPEFRGRGVASALKRRAVEFARDRGFRYLVTNNDSLNRPIWAINEKLGFQKQATWLLGEKPLRPAAAPL
jgi:mycothiol synthase